MKPVDVTKVAPSAGETLTVALTIADPYATQVRNWAEQAGKEPSAWLEEQINHVFVSGWLPAV